MGSESFVRPLLLALLAPALLCTNRPAFAQRRSVLDARADEAALQKIAPLPYVDLCSTDVPAGAKRCFAKAVSDGYGHPLRLEAAPRSAFGPADLRDAYKLPSSGGAGKTVALVDAYHYKNAEADLATYRTMYGLPACTSANGCFKQVDATGAPSTLKEDPMGCSGWPGEAALD